MSGIELILAAWQVSDLQSGQQVAAVDSDERPVTVFMPRPDAAVPDGAGYPVLELLPVDLDPIESPEGLHCESTDGATGWLVRVAS